MKFDSGLMLEEAENDDDPPEWNETLWIRDSRSLSLTSGELLVYSLILLFNFSFLKQNISPLAVLEDQLSMIIGLIALYHFI